MQVGLVVLEGGQDDIRSYRSLLIVLEDGEQEWKDILQKMFEQWTVAVFELDHGALRFRVLGDMVEVEEVEVDVLSCERVLTDLLEVVLDPVITGI